MNPQISEQAYGAAIDIPLHVDCEQVYIEGCKLYDISDRIREWNIQGDEIPVSHSEVKSK